jgi:hypothetical protein
VDQKAAEANHESDDTDRDSRIPEYFPFRQQGKGADDEGDFQDHFAGVEAVFAPGYDSPFVFKLLGLFADLVFVFLVAFRFLPIFLA